MMNILVINTAYWGGGAEAVARQLYQKVDGKLYHMFFLAGYGSLKFSRCIYPTKDLRGFRNAFLFMHTLSHKINGWYFNDRIKMRNQYALNMILQAIKDYQIDIVHFHNIHGGYMGIDDIGYVAERCKIVWTLHDMWALTGHCAHAFTCEKWWKDECRNCQNLYRYEHIFSDVAQEMLMHKKISFTGKNIQFVVPSQWLYAQCRKSILNKEKISVIPNSVDLSLFYPKDVKLLRKQYYIKHDRIVIMFVMASLDNEYKGMDVLLTALEKLKNKNRYALLVCGNIPKDKNKDLKVLDEFVTYQMGFLKDVNIMCNMYNIADVFVTASRAESFSLVSLESIACGTPVIGSRVGGIPEIVTDEVGWCFENGNSNQLAELIENLEPVTLSSKAEHCRSVAESLYGEEEMINKYKRIYESLYNEKNNAL